MLNKVFSEEQIQNGKEFLNIFNKLIKKTNRMIITSFGSPYLIQDFKDAPVYICAYKGSTLLQKAVGNALIGNSNISGINLSSRGCFIQIETVL